MKLNHLARALQQPQATVFRILYTLEQLGYVQRDPQAETYRLTGHVGWLTGHEFRETLKRTARPSVENLRRQFERTVCLAMLHHDQLLYVDILDGLRSIRMAPTVNTHAPLHSTALGEAILSCLSAAELNQALRRRPPVRLIPNTITSVRVLVRHLPRSANRGTPLIMKTRKSVPAPWVLPFAAPKVNPWRPSASQVQSVIFPRTVFLRSPVRSRRPAGFRNLLPFEVRAGRL